MKKKISIWKILKLIWSNKEARELITYIFYAVSDFKLTDDEKTGIKTRSKQLLDSLLQPIYK